MLLNSISIRIKYDIRNISQKINERVQFKNDPLLQCLLSNSIPSKWLNKGFESENNTLLDYFRILLLKTEYLMELFETKQLKSINVSKIIDPCAFLLFIMWDYSISRNFSFYNLKMVLRKIKKLDDIKTEGISIQGISIKNAAINNNNYLVEEKSRDFESEFPLVKISAQKKILKYSNTQKDTCISVEFYEANSFDIEGDYEEQRKNPPTFFKYNTLAKNKSAKNLLEKPTIFFVRIPIMNPLQRNMNVSSVNGFYFFFRSYRPQEFWTKRNTQIVFK